MPLVLPSLDRLDRALVVATAAAAIASIPARANPWNFVIIEDGIAPGLVVLMAVAIATLVVRWALCVTRIDPADYDGPLPRLVIALAPYPLLLIGLIIIPVLVWPSAVDAAASIGRDDPADIIVRTEDGDLVVVVRQADCILGIEGTVDIEARRGIASRRQRLYDRRECGHMTAHVVQESGSATVDVTIDCTANLITVDAKSLEVLNRESYRIVGEGCVGVQGGVTP